MLEKLFVSKASPLISFFQSLITQNILPCQEETDAKSRKLPSHLLEVNEGFPRLAVVTAFYLHKHFDKTEEESKEPEKIYLDGNFMGFAGRWGARGSPPSLELSSSDEEEIRVREKRETRVTLGKRRKTRGGKGAKAKRTT